MRSIYALGLVMFLLSALGCSSTTTRTYEVTVKNETDHPVTVWLTKTGSPAEKNWNSPEQLALVAPGYEERFSGVLVPPGKTAYTGPVKGEFYSDGIAWLRVYYGKYDALSDLLAVSPGGKRIDQPLNLGRNSLVVQDKAGKMSVSSAPSLARQPIP